MVFRCYTSTGLLTILLLSLFWVAAGLYNDSTRAGDPPAATQLAAGGGPQKMLALLVRFPDKANSTSTSAVVSNLLASLNNYYSEDSYGSFSFLMDVYPSSPSAWYLLPDNMTYYGVDTPALDAQLVSDSLKAAYNAGVNVTSYKYAIVIHAGDDESLSGASTDIFSNAIPSFIFKPTPSVTYMIPSAYFAESDRLGILAHESGHLLGLPDLYDVTGAIDPINAFLGYWDLMARGLWNPSGNALIKPGTYPSHHSSWSKIQLGFIPSSRITTVQVGQSVNVVVQNLELPTAETQIVMIPVAINPDGRLTYYLVETRAKLGTYDNYLPFPSTYPNAGLLIYKVNESIPFGTGTVRLIDAHPGGGLGDAPFGPCLSPCVSNSTFTDSSNYVRVTVTAAASTAYTITVDRTGPFLTTAIKDSSGNYMLNITVGNPVHDTASFDGGAGTVTGTVTYEFFSNGFCTTSPVSTQTVMISASNVVPDSSPVTPVPAGLYSFQAVYSGDASHNPATSPCEPLRVDKATPTVAAALKDSSGTVVSSLSVGASVHDTATLSGGFDPVSGTVKYRRYYTADCSGGSSDSIVTIGPGNIVPDSSLFTPTSPGSISYQAVYQGDANNNYAASLCQPLTVQSSVKATPSITTGVSDTSSVTVTTVTVGKVVHDTATLSGGSGAITGTVSYTLFSNGICSGTGTVVSTVTVGAGNVVPDSASVTPSPAGAYSFQAMYSGDANNNPSTSPCEPLNITKVSPSISTAIKDASGTIVTTVTAGGPVHDTATLSGGFSPITGTVNYTLFDNNSCSGTGTLNSTVSVAAGGAVPDSAAVTPSPAGPYSFKAVYNGDSNNNPAASACEPLTVSPSGKTSTSITTTTRDGSGTAVNSVITGTAVHDTAVLSNGSSPTGTLAYFFFSNEGCSGSGTLVSNVTVTGGVVPDSGNVNPQPAGLYSFQASYSGDASNDGANSPCEPLAVNKATPSIATAVRDLAGTIVTSITVGASTHDTATLYGGFGSLSDMLTYSLFSTIDCTGASTDETVTVGLGNYVPDSTTYTPTAAGGFSYRAVYNGDANNNPVIGPCQQVIAESPVVFWLTVVTPSPGTLVSIDGKNWTSDSNSEVRVQVPYGSHSVFIQPRVPVNVGPVTIPVGLVRTFSSWNDGSTDNPRVISVDRETRLTANYQISTQTSFYAIALGAMLLSFTLTVAILRRRNRRVSNY